MSTKSGHFQVRFDIWHLICFTILISGDGYLARKKLWDLIRSRSNQWKLLTKKGDREKTESLIAQVRCTAASLFQRDQDATPYLCPVWCCRVISPHALRQLVFPCVGW
ncbi:hypothetical protein ACQJBY_033892 [Aegilops geniculata]